MRAFRSLFPFAFLTLLTLCLLLNCGVESKSTLDDDSLGGAGGASTEPRDDEREVTPGVAIDEDFQSWQRGDRGFDVVNGDAREYPESGTAKTVEGQDCLWIQGKAADNGGFGFSVAFQVELDTATDMSGEDYVLSYDLYVPEETYDLGVNAQASLWRTSDYTPIYSVWFTSSVARGSWSTLTVPINTTDGLIDYSGFDENPGEWAFDAVRVQAIINGEQASAGDEVSFCVDNLSIKRVEKDDEPDETDEDDEQEDSPFQVRVNDAEIPVTRLGSFDVPVNYVRMDHGGEMLDVVIDTKDGIESFSLSPKSEGLDAKLTSGTLRFSVAEPSYLILEGAHEERLFLLFDPEEQEPPRPGDEDVVDLSDAVGIDATGESESTEALQAAIDAASGADRNIVYVPAGLYAVETLFLRDDMTLYLADGAVLKNITPQADLISHARDLTVIEGSSRGLIVMNDISGARLMGRGTLDGNGAHLQSFDRKMFLVKIENSQDCIVDGVISRDSAFWNTLVYRSENITISNYKVINNQLADEWNETDGVDFDNCRDSELTNAFLYTGDDCMAVKSDDIEDDFELEGILDPTEGSYIDVARISHDGIVCHSASSACKVGTKTFGQTMSDISFTDIDVVQAGRGLVIDAVDTAEITGTLFEDVRIESVSGRLIDFNMDPEAITWRTNPGICTVSDTRVVNVHSEVEANVRIQGNVHDYNEEGDPYHGNEYYIDGVSFDDFSIAGVPITQADDIPSLTINAYATDLSFQ